MTIFLITLIIIGALFITILHFRFRAPRIKETATPASIGALFQEVSIPTVSKSKKKPKQLFGWLLPVEHSTETLVILHGWGGNAEMMLPIAAPFHKAGINILLIDSRNHGNSDSDSFSSMPRFAEDLNKSIQWLNKKHPNKSQKIAVLGHSVGASAILLAASKNKQIDAVISISAFAHPEWLMQRFLENLHLRNVHLPQFLIAFILRYIQWVIGHSFVDIASLHVVCDVDVPILLVHGKEDLVVPIDDARAIIKHCSDPHISLLEIDDAGHESVDKFEQHAEKLITFLCDSGFTEKIRSQ